MTDREIMQQALDAMERYQVKSGDFDGFDDVIKNLRQALAQPEHLSLRDEAKRFALMQGGGGAGGRGWFDGLGSGCDIWKLK